MGNDNGLVTLKAIRTKKEHFIRRSDMIKEMLLEIDKKQKQNKNKSFILKKLSCAFHANLKNTSILMSYINMLIQNIIIK